MSASPPGREVSSPPGVAEAGTAGYRGPRPRNRRHLYRYLASLAVVILIFAFALPHLADYGDAWTSLTAMTRYELAAVLAAGLWNLMTYWPVLMISLPGLRLGEAAVVNQASTAVSNAVPAGGAVALGVTYRVLRTWGFTSRSIANLVVATSVWNNMVKLGLPVIVVATMVFTGALRESTSELAAVGLLALIVSGLVAARLLAHEEAARRVGSWIDSAIARVRRSRARPGGTDVTGWLLRTRIELIALVRRRGAAMTAVSLVSHLSLYLVLLTAIRAIGVSDDQLDWEKILAGFAFVRLLSALPVTPGGFGVVEFGYVAYLTAGAEHLSADVTAAVLLFRAITFVFPVALGGVAWAVFTTRTSWRRPSDSRGALDAPDLDAGSVT